MEQQRTQHGSVAAVTGAHEKQKIVNIHCLPCSLATAQGENPT